MLMPASSEFVDLCRSQLALIVEGLGAASCAVYLAEEFADVSRRNLIPIALYPDSPYNGPPYSGPNYTSPTSPTLSQAQGLATASMQVLPMSVLPTTLSASAVSSASAQLSPEATTNLTPVVSTALPQEGLVIPLLHNNLVFGILVARRADRDWTTREQEQLTEVSHTLALACVLDQRHQWLQQSDYEQRSFLNRQYDTLANLLHQIRNPLTTVRTLAKLLFKRQPTGSKEQELVASILQESEHLQQLLQQFDQTIDVGEALLGQGASESSPTPPQPPTLSLPAATSPVGTTLVLQPLQLVDLLRPLLLANQALADERQQTLTADWPDDAAVDLPPVMADPKALREVLGNLLDNAIKYTPVGGHIHVSLSRHQNRPHSQQVIGVSDTGPGIPASDLPQLGQRHYRGVQASGAIPGTGLGLAIARELMVAMQGSLEVRSPALWQPDPPMTNPGSGSSFLLTLPECH
jgi:signal transduction histidine kinase